jgi:mycofactocin precursor
VRVHRAPSLRRPLCQWYVQYQISEKYPSGVDSCPEEVGMLAEDRETQDVDVEELSDEDVDELLVEEVSIDGMCGVY